MNANFMTRLMLSFFLLAIASLGTVSAWSYNDPESFPNLIRNGGFEMGKDSKEMLPGWSFVLSRLPGFKKSGYYWESPGYAGEKSLGLTAGDVEPAIIWTEMSNIQFNTYYLLQFLAKRDSFTEGVYLETELFESKKRWDNHLLSGGWQKFFGLFYSQDIEGISYLKFINSFPEKFLLDEISLLAYRISLNPPEFDPRTHTVKLSWREPEHDLALQFRIQFSRNLPFSPAASVEITNSGPLALELTGNLAKGNWFWQVEAFHGDQTIAISEIGQYRGDSFFPIGIYGVPVEELEEVHDAGFNIAQNYSEKPEFLGELLEKAGSTGIQVLIPPPDSEEFILKARESPALFAWYLADEPEGRSVPPKLLLQRKEKLKSLDPGHPTAIVVVRPWASFDYALATDILMSDQYPIPHAPLTWLSDSIEEMKQAVRGSKPIWAVIQAFMNQKEGWPREPTYAEMRALTFLSLVHGAEGIFYYTYKGGSYNIRESEEHWENVKKVVDQLNKLKEWLPLRNYVEDTVLTITSPFKTAANGSPAIHHALSKRENKTLLLAVNVIDRPVTMKISGLADNSYPLEVLFEKRRLAVVDGILYDTFLPYETHVYYSDEDGKK